MIHDKPVRPVGGNPPPSRYVPSGAIRRAIASKCTRPSETGQSFPPHFDASPRIHNSGPTSLGACSFRRGTVHYPPAIFEVARPTVDCGGPPVIVQGARGSRPTSRGLVNPRTLHGRAQVR
jgi:hypothetical protein